VHCHSEGGEKPPHIKSDEEGINKARMGHLLQTTNKPSRIHEKRIKRKTWRVESTPPETGVEPVTLPLGGVRDKAQEPGVDLSE
jgi:hypothetical protein